VGWGRARPPPFRPSPRLRRAVRGAARSIACALILFIAGTGTALAQARPAPVDLELILAVDVSGSIDEEEAGLQRQGYVAAIADPEVVRAIISGMLGRIAVTYFEWAGDTWQVPVLPWTLIDSPQTAQAFAAKLAAAPLGSGPWTSISDAIRTARPMFDVNEFEGTRRILDISGDGPNNTGGLVEPERDLAVATRITINGLPIINDRFNVSRAPMPNLDLYYRNCVIGGPGAFLVLAHGFKSFAQAIRRKLILEIADLSPNRPDRITATGLAQAGKAPPKSRWVPPCDEGERRFRGVIEDQ
jgi:hypothetical protein